MFSKILIFSLLFTAILARPDDDDDDDNDDNDSGYDYRAPVYSPPRPLVRNPVPKPQTLYTAPKPQTIYIAPQPVRKPQPSYSAPVPAPQISYSAPVPAPSAPRPTYDESEEEEELPLMPFNFGYEVKDEERGTDFEHRSDSDGQIVNGEYRVALPDGRTQIVKYYVTKEDGYVAQVTYEGEARPWVPPAESDEDSQEVPQAAAYQIPKPAYQTPVRLYQADF